MLTSETKRKIDNARQVLVGVLPNPMQQVEQITTALIYKFMDDMDEKSRKLGGKASFFTSDYKKYAWHNLMDTRLGNQEKLNLYQEAITNISKNPKIPQLFRDIFSKAYLPFNSPRVLGLFLSEIDGFDYSHSEELGNAYEYLLSIMGSQGDAGQFRTPRHIIDFIVEVVDPQKGERILDPACGTAGFLISAYKHILANHDGIDNKTGKPTKKEKPLTADERTKLHKNIVGYDIDGGMTRTAQVNMYLHGFKNPDIRIYDTLSDDKYWDEEYDVIMANPPFMTPKGGIKPHSKFNVQANRSEVLFVDYIVEHLNINGRAGIIVPEGIIFQSATAYKKLRKMLVDDGLYAVVSLPSGIFQPYTGVKTSILLFDNNIAKRTDYILFAKVENDGFSLGAQRREIEDNDLPQITNTLRAYKKYILGDYKKNENVFMDFIINDIKTRKDDLWSCFYDKYTCVNKKYIADNDEYNLTGELYRRVELKDMKWPMAKVSDLCELGRGRVISKKDIEKNPGEYPVYSSQTVKNGCFGYLGSYDFDGEYVTWTTDGANAGTVFYRKGKFNCTNVCGTLKSKTDKVLMKYLAVILNTVAYKHVIHVGNPKLMNNVMGKIEVPLPPLDIQKQFVEELDGYQKIIDGARQVVDNWKPQVKIDPGWKKLKIGEICDVFGGGTPSRSNKEYWGGNIPWLSARYFSDNHTINGAEMITEKGLKNSSSKIAPKGSTILITRVSVGKFAIADKDYAINQDLTALVVKNKKIVSPKYLWLISEIVAKKIKQNANGIAVTGVTREFVVKQEIPLPSVKIQEQIVDKIETERKIVGANKQLIEIYGQKIKDKISEVWV